MQTGENEQSLRKILDMTRLMSIAILALHFYYYCYTAFEQWQLTATLSTFALGFLFIFRHLNNIFFQPLTYFTFTVESIEITPAIKPKLLSE